MTKYHELSEQTIQRAVCQHLHQRGAAGLVWFHVPNGGRRSRLRPRFSRASVFVPEFRT